MFFGVFHRRQVVRMSSEGRLRTNYKKAVCNGLRPFFQTAKHRNAISILINVALAAVTNGLKFGVRSASTANNSGSLHPEIRTKNSNFNTSNEKSDTIPVHHHFLHSRSGAGSRGQARDSYRVRWIGCPRNPQLCLRVPKGDYVLIVKWPRDGRPR